MSDRDPVTFAKSSDNYILIATNSELVLLRDGKKLAAVPVAYKPLSANFHPTKPTVAIGGQVHIIHIVVYFMYVC